MKKKMLLISAAALVVSLLAACGGNAANTSAPNSEALSPGLSPSASPAPASASSPAPASSTSEERAFTEEELAAYNGKNGQPAYVAVDGVVYDVTNVPEWENGEHMAGLTAGQDLTEEITNQSPHGLRVLGDLPVVGRLA